MSDAQPVVLVIDDEDADPALPARGIRARELHRAGGRERRRGAARGHAAAGRSASWSISDCRTLDGADDRGARPRPGRRCRSSCCRCARARTRRSACSSSAPTTMWSSRSAWRSCWRAHARPCAGTRAASPESRSSTLGPLTVDLATRAVSIDGARLQLSPKEYRLLQVLAQHAGNVVTHQHLLKEVWGLQARARRPLSPHLRAQAPPARSKRIRLGRVSCADRARRRLPACAGRWRDAGATLFSRLGGAVPAFAAFAEAAALAFTPIT